MARACSAESLDPHNLSFDRNKGSNLEVDMVSTAIVDALTRVEKDLGHLKSEKPGPDCPVDPNATLPRTDAR